LIVWNGEKYCTATEAAALLHVSRPTFYQNVKGQLKLHELPARKRPHYKLSDVEYHQKVKEVIPVLEAPRVGAS
jgi:hypothetical protein